MSTQGKYPTIEESVRARIALGAPDAPVFAAAFYSSKIKTSHDEHVIFHTRASENTSTLRAGPGSGQTPGFARRAEVEVKHSIVPRENPELLRLPQRTDELILHLRTRDVDVPPVFSSKTVYSTQTIDAAPGITIAPSSWKPPAPPSRWEEFHASLQNRAQQADSIFLSFLRVIKERHILSRIYILCAQMMKKVRYSLVFSFDIVCAGTSGIEDGLNILGRKLLSYVRVATQLLRRQKKFFYRKRSVKIRVWLPSFSFPHIALPSFSKKRAVGAFGQGLIVMSLVLFLMTVGPILRLQAGEWWEQTRTAVTGKAQEPAVRETLMDVVRKPEETPPEDKQFQLLIPKLNANLKVIPNVDAGDEKAYTDALKRGVAHAAGSGLPGETNATNRTVYIFGHSTNGVWNIAKYNALFYSLKDLSVGDEIIVWFWGKEFHYKVSQVVKIDPSDLTYLAPQTIKDQLILQTCWPPGTVWKRLLVIADPVK